MLALVVYSLVAQLSPKSQVQAPVDSPNPRLTEAGKSLSSRSGVRFAALFVVGIGLLLLFALWRGVTFSSGEILYGLLAIGLVLLVLSLGLVASGRHASIGELTGNAAVGLLTGVLVGMAVFAATRGLENQLLNAQNSFEEDRFARDSRRDDLRFVREVVLQPNASLKPFSGLELGGAPLSGFNLSDADLDRSDLSAAELIDTDLSGASLINAELRDAVLLGADLTGARISGADFSGASLDRVSLVNVEASRANFHNAVLCEADLSGASFGDRICLALTWRTWT